MIATPQIPGKRRQNCNPPALIAAIVTDANGRHGKLINTRLVRDPTPFPQFFFIAYKYIFVCNHRRLYYFTPFVRLLHARPLMCFKINTFPAFLRVPPPAVNFACVCVYVAIFFILYRC